MTRTSLRLLRAYALLAAFFIPSSACRTSEEFGADKSRASYFHVEDHPTHWLGWTTDGAASIEMGDAFLTHGVRCSGRYCDDVDLLAAESGHRATRSWWTDSFSEEGTNYRVCDGEGFVTGVRCSGSYCDNLSLRCSEIDGGRTRSNCFWTSGLSEEGGGRYVAPESTYVAGMSCNGRYCDDLALYVCQADAGGPGVDVDGLAHRFAPRLRFDQETTTGSGEQSKCFPSDPQAYVEARSRGVNPIDLCNKDYGAVQNGRVPTYYVATTLGTNTVLIRYWYFYAWQSTCFASAGSHSADWESMAVLVVDGQLSRVAFYQHGGWYSRERGSYQLEGDTHPVGYVGKNAHGTYHDDGGSGGCLYFEDFRNPGGDDYHMDTWANLTPITRGGGSPSWMNCEGSSCFDGIGHPLDQTGDLRMMSGCGKDGCGRSSVPGNMSFANDPAGSDFTAVEAQHSGLVLDVPGASQDDGVAIDQFSNWNVDHERFWLESTGDGYFTIRARHSGKCLDVSGASRSGGAPVVQYHCTESDNQRFRLLSYGNGSFAVQAKHSGQCLDIAGWSTSDGGRLIQWPCAWTPNQTFRFRR